MKNTFTYNAFDKQYYETKIRDFIPDKIIDIHSHVWLDKYIVKKPGNDNRVAKWITLVAKESPIKELAQTYKTIFPDKNVTPLIFSNVSSTDDKIAELNKYTMLSAKEYRYPSLLFSSPLWTAEELDTRLIKGGFLGIKPYLTMAGKNIPASEIRIFDFLPHHHMEVLNRRGLIVMLHIPRNKRLKDPLNLEQMIEIERKYPNIKLIIAHVGRAYSMEDLGDSMQILAKNTKTMMFDFCANTNREVFVELIKAVGHKRILFGSDLPITRMRMKRITENGSYINVVPKGLYGDVSGDKHMREIRGDEAKKLSLFIYEEINSFLEAAKTCGLSKTDIEYVFYNNAKSLIDTVLQQVKKQKTGTGLQLKMVWPHGTGKVKYSVPKGYSLRSYKKGDEKEYIRLMRQAGFTFCNMKFVKETVNRVLQDSLFFVVHNKTKKLVATACCGHTPTERFRSGGDLGWVAGDKKHSRKGLGYIVCAAVVNRFIERGYKTIYLSTDDNRLPAIKIYLKLGFTPYYFAPGMKNRWKEVFKKLSIKNIPRKHRI